MPFSSPRGVAVDGSGNVYVADYGGSKVYEMTPNCASGSTACITTLGNGTMASHELSLSRCGGR